MQFVANIAIPLLVAFAMGVVGLELTLADFRRVLHYPAAVASVITTQFVLLPLIAWLVAYLVRADNDLTAGLLLIAACPIAASASYYALLARVDVALAVTLTAVSSLCALAAMPLAVAVAFEFLFHQRAAVHVPILPAARQLLLGLALPIGVGMVIRRLASDWSGRWRKTLQRLSLLALAPVLVFVLADQAAALGRGLAQLLLATLLFTLVSVALCYALAMVFWSAVPSRAAVAIGFCDRNLSAAIMFAAAVLGRMDFVAVCAAFFLAQAALLVPTLLWLRRKADARAALRPALGD